MLKTDINSVKERLLTLTSKVDPDSSSVIREACRNLDSLGDQVGCLEAHFTLPVTDSGEEFQHAHV